ncbi:MAG: sensor histidine kinase, partial [Bacillota bacterium]
VFRLSVTPWTHLEHMIQMLRTAEVLERYFLGFPGAALAAIGLWAGRKEFVELGGRRSSVHVGFAVIGFVLYAFLGGLVVPSANFFPATWLNSRIFYHLTGLPVHIFRAADALLITYGVIGIVRIFNIESKRMLADSERIQAVHEERLRIARDLHDGAIQSFYGVSLHLQRLRMLRQDDNYLQGELIENLREISRAIQELRGFVSGLKDPSSAHNLAERLSQLMEAFQRSTNISGVVHIHGPGSWEPPPAMTNDIYLIVRESLNNAARHGNPSEVEVIYLRNDEEMNVEIRDDGCGFNLEEVQSGSGLENIRERASHMGGDILISSSPGKGTVVKIKIPKEAVISE